MRMTLRKVSKVELRELLINPDGIFDFIDNDVTQGQELDLDKAWHGLHFMLTGTAWEGAEPLAYLLAGGHTIGNDEEHDVGYGPARGLTDIEVKQFANALDTITQAEFQARYNSARMDALEIYPIGWSQEANPQEMVEWMTSSFIQMTKFVGGAAGESAALLIYL
ncbi:YfbM family protein [Hymenobacter rigui]|nr:YfbM family protein [Hymenobacter rigui]